MVYIYSRIAVILLANCTFVVIIFLFRDEMRFMLPRLLLLLLLLENASAEHLNVCALVWDAATMTASRARALSLSPKYVTEQNRVPDPCSQTSQARYLVSKFRVFKLRLYLIS